jgi:predicted DNA-binding helix-hairpin-helix protein
MFYNKPGKIHLKMSDPFLHLRELSSDMSLETAEDGECPKLSTRQQQALNISYAQMPGGKRITLLKTLLTSACERNCHYCPFRAGRDFRRATLQPDEMAGVFMSLHRAGIVQGMFLSSGIAGGSLRTQDQLLATAEILRKKHQFKGYLHLKLMPGAEQAQVEQAVQLSDRVSLNLEAPNIQRLERLAPGKIFFDELVRPLRWVDDIRRAQSPQNGWNSRWPSMTTQFVVGAVGESDLELLVTTETLHRQLRLGRAYFSAFHPVTNTPFEGLPPESPQRVHHLYLASFLLRDYGFSVEELPFDASGNLPARADPKLAWAELNLKETPVEINRGDRAELLRIPGIGPKGAEAILKARRKGRLESLEDLRRIGINPSRAKSFILFDGKPPAQQLAFW